MDRREFVKAAATAGGVALAEGLRPLFRAAEPQERPDLVVSKGGDPERAVRAAIESWGSRGHPKIRCS